MEDIFNKKKEEKPSKDLEKVDAEVISEENIKIEDVVSTGSLESISDVTEDASHTESHEIDDNQKTAQFKTIVYFLIAIAIIIGALFAFNYFGDNFYKKDPLTIDAMHELNIKGELEPDRGYFYNGLSYVYFNALWNTKIQKGEKVYDVGLHYGPKEIENVSLSGKINSDFSTIKEVFLVYNPHDTNLQNVNVAFSEMSFNLVNTFKKLPKAACSQEHEVCEGVPTFNCSNNKEDYIIQFETTEENAEVVLDGNCIILRGKETEITKATNRLLWWWYDVMKN